MDWYTAPVRSGSLSAFDDGASLVISGIAVTPSSGFLARAITLPMDTYPPEFAIEIAPPSDSAPDSMTDVPFKTKFERLPGVRSIVIYAAEGVHVVPIHVTAAGASSRAADVRRATGYSSDFNFEEAFRQAVSQIAVQSDFAYVRVVEVGATTGIFPFQQRMYVTVERGAND